MLGKQIANGNPYLNPSDRISLVADSAALAMSGSSSTMEFLSFVKTLKHESNFFVWDEVFNCLSQLRCAWSEQPKPVLTGLREFSKSLLTAKVEEIGWNGTPTDDPLTSQLRPLLIKNADCAQIKGYSSLQNILRVESKKKPREDFALGVAGLTQSYRHPFAALSSELF
jgi:hypothetical protein